VHDPSPASVTLQKLFAKVAAFGKSALADMDASALALAVAARHARRREKGHATPVCGGGGVHDGDDGRRGGRDGGDGGREESPQEGRKV
jgi:hypothetical protein